VREGSVLPPSRLARFGPITAVDGLDLEVPEGICLGLLGPNGAGKSTMFRMLCGLARPSRGTVRVLAESTVSDPETSVAEAIRIRRALGELPVPVLLHGEEDGAWPVLEYAVRMGMDTRIGFEDVLLRPDGWLATGNDDLVKAALAIRV